MADNFIVEKVITTLDPTTDPPSFKTTLVGETKDAKVARAVQLSYLDGGGLVEAYQESPTAGDYPLDGM
jgi:hypothetical protein